MMNNALANALTTDNRSIIRRGRFIGIQVSGWIPASTNTSRWNRSPGRLAKPRSIATVKSSRFRNRTHRRKFDVSLIGMRCSTISPVSRRHQKTKFFVKDLDV